MIEIENVSTEEYFFNYKKSQLLKYFKVPSNVKNILID